MATAAELAQATPEQIAEARTAITAHLAASWPTLSIASGPLADLLCGPAADALTAVDARARAAEASLDPYTALAEGGYDEEVLEAALAGLGVTRGGAASAAGVAALTFSDATPRSVSAGYRMATADGLFYRTSEGVRLLPPGSAPQQDADRVMVVDPAGGFVGTIAVVAERTGDAGNRPAGTALRATVPIPTQTSAYLATDATGGSDQESDADLLARLPAASAPRTASSFEGIEGVVRAAADFSDVAVVGYGHAGMMRGRSVLTGQTPGRADARVRVDAPPGRTRLRVLATYVGVVGPYGQWRFSVKVGDAPGWYAVERVVQVNAVMTSGGYVPAVTTGFDLTGANPAPDIRLAMDAAFSVYATATVVFSDPDTATAGLTPIVSTKEYDAILRVIPGVDEAQVAVDAPEARPSGGDCLVRGAAPVHVSLTVAATVQVGVGLTAEAVAAAVAQAVNDSAINSVIHASVVGAAALALLPAGTTLQLSGWIGVVHKGDGAVNLITGTAGLTVPTDWSVGLGPDTVAFYCDPESVTATVTVV